MSTVKKNVHSFIAIVMKIRTIVRIYTGDYTGRHEHCYRAIDISKIENVIRMTNETTLFHISQRSDHSCMAAVILLSRKHGYISILLRKKNRADQ